MHGHIVFLRRIFEKDKRVKVSHYHFCQETRGSKLAP